MSARVEAAVDAFMRSYLGPQSEHNVETRVGAAMDAADSVLFSEAAIERAAKAAEAAGDDWIQFGHKAGVDLNLSVARAVVAALREEA
jgi:hypothetical protein